MFKKIKEKLKIKKEGACKLAITHKILFSVLFILALWNGSAYAGKSMILDVYNQANSSNSLYIGNKTVAPGGGSFHYEGGCSWTDICRWSSNVFRVDSKGVWTLVGEVYVDWPGGTCETATVQWKPKTDSAVVADEIRDGGRVCNALGNNVHASIKLRDKLINASPGGVCKKGEYHNMEARGECWKKCTDGFGNSDKNTCQDCRSDSDEGKENLKAKIPACKKYF